MFTYLLFHHEIPINSTNLQLHNMLKADVSKPFIGMTDFQTKIVRIFFNYHNI